MAYSINIAYIRFVAGTQGYLFVILNPLFIPCIYSCIVPLQALYYILY
jgi:hypothetical protein